MVRRVAFLVYWGALGLLAWLSLFWIRMEFLTHRLLEGLAWLVLLGALAVLVLETILRFTPMKLKGTLGSTVLVAAAILAYPILSWWPAGQLLYRTRAGTLDELAREALTYGRIHELQSFSVYESLNGWPILGPERISFDATANRPRRIVVDTALGVFVTEPELIGYHEDLLERILPLVEGVPVDTVADSLDAELRVALPLEEALRRTDVDPTRYEWFRSRLRRAGMGSMAVGSRHVVFWILSGCDAPCGLAYLPDGLHEPDGRTPEGRLATRHEEGELGRVAPHWYFGALDYGRRAASTVSRPP